MLLTAQLSAGASAFAQNADNVHSGIADSQEPPPSGVLTPFDRLRAAAHDKGIDLRLRYISETANNPRGGREQEVAESGQVDFQAKLDMEKIAGLNGGTFETVVTWRRGQLLDKVAGIDPLQQVQEIYGRGQILRLTRFWYEQQLGDVAIKVGRANTGEDFASFSCDFMNLTFGGAQPGNIAGDYWFNWPVSQWAARLKVPVSDGYLQIGAYEVNPRNLEDDFFLGKFSGATGVLVPVEAVWKPKLDGRSGTYRIGGWYDTSQADDVVLDRNRRLARVTAAPALQRDGRWGVWLVARQQITGSDDGNGGRHGLALFLRATQADKRTTRLSNQIALGLFIEGLAPSGDDAVGLAVGRTHVNERVTRAERAEPSNPAVQHDEFASELFYSLHPWSGVVLRPNVQYIVNPGGRHVADAVILGLKASITL